MKVFLCLATVLAIASALEYIKQCPNLEVQEDFLLANFTGTWYKQYGMNTPWELGTCIQSVFALNETTQELAVDVSLKTLLGGALEIRGSAVQTNTSSTEGKLTLTLTTYFGTTSGNMWILSSDYDNYAIVYSCRQVSLAWWSEPYESVWVLTRERTVTSDITLLIKAAMDVISHDGGPSYYELTSSAQKNCS